jgi:hypothetical protein
LGAKRPLRKFLKILGIVLGTIIVILVGFHFWFMAHAKQLLERMVESKSNGKVKMKVGKLRFGYFSNIMELDNAVFYNTDTIHQNTSYRFSVHKIKLEVEAMWPVIFKQQFLIDSLTLVEPDIRVTRLKASDKKDAKDSVDVSIPGEMGKVYNSIRDALKVLKVTRFRIVNGTFTLVNKIKPGQLPMTIGHLNFRIDNFQVDTSNLSARDKILFSDNITLSSDHQNIIFPDGRHRLSFSSFNIDLQKKLVTFDSCTIAATRSDSSTSSFNVFMDALYLTNIDFDTLYRSEVIKADSVYCVNPTFTLQVDVGKKKEGNSPAPKLEDIIKQLTGDLQLGRVVVSNADFNIKTIRDGNPSSFTFTQNNFEMEGLDIDQEAPKSIKVKSFAMAIRNYENFIKDSSYSIQFDSILLKDDRITLSNFVFNKLKNGRILNTFSMPQFNLQGLSWDDLVFEKKLKAEQAIMFNPRISYTVTDTKKRGRQNIFQSLGAVNDYMDLQYLDVIDGSIDLKLKDDLQIRLDSATIAIKSHSLLTSTKLAGIKNSLTRLYFKKGSIHAGNLAIELNNIRYIGNTGQFEAGFIGVSNDQENMKISLQNASVERMQVDEQSSTIYASGVTWQKGDIKISSGGAGATAAKKPVFIELHNVHGLNTSIDGKFGGKQIATKINHLSFSELIKNTGSKLKLTSLNLSGEQLQVKDSSEDLSVTGFDIADNQRSAFRQIAYKTNREKIEADIAIPSLVLTPHIQPLLDGKVSIDDVSMEKPVIQLHLVSTKSNHTENNFSYPAIDINKLELTQPSIHFTQVQDSGSFSLSWLGNKQASDFLSITGFNVAKGSALNATLKNIRLSLSGFAFNDIKGKRFNTGEGKIDAQVRNLELMLENNLPAEWQAVVTSFDAKNFRLDSMDKKNGSLVMNSAVVTELNISSQAVINLQKLAGSNPIFQLKNVTGNFSDADKELRWYNAGFNRQRNNFSIDSFSYSPAISKDSFLTRQAYQADYLNLKTGAIQIGPIDIDRFISDDKLNAGTMIVHDAFLTDYKDKRLPMRKDFIKPLPSTLIKNLPLKLSMDTLVLDNANIEYTELNPKTNVATLIPVRRLNAKISNIRNYDISSTDSLRIRAEAYLLDTVWLRLRVKESYTDSLNGFLMTLRLKPTDMRLLNPILIPTSNVKIRSGFIDTVNLRAIGREYLSHGEMQMFYHDLKVRILKAGDTTSKSGSGLLNFIVNAFVIKNKNTSRTGQAFFIRDRQRSAINYLLRIAMSGVTSSVGAKSNRKVLKQYSKEIRERKLPPIDLD